LISRTMLAGSFVVMTWFWMAFGNSSLAHIPYSNLLTTSANNVRF
jgi:hypothetical protein